MKIVTEELKFADLFPEEAGKLAQRLHIKKDEIPFIRKFFTSEKSEVQPKERAVISYISTAIKDRDGEKLLPEGVVLDNYRNNPVVLWGHDYKSMPVGKNLWIKQDEKGLIAKTVFANNERSDEVYRAYTEDIGGTGPLLRAFSVGFVPIDWEDTEQKALEENKDLPRRIYKKWELLEYSTVPIPSCPEALTLAVEKGLIPKGMKKAMDKYIEVEDFQEEAEVEIEGEIKTMTPDELKEHYRGERVIEVEEFNHTEGKVIEVIAKPETTDNYHRIPVSSGHEGHKIRTITVSAKQGIKALYCVDCKKIKTYLFDTSKWSMEAAQAWVKDHKGILERFEAREASKAKEEFKCECPECGYKLTTTEHCKDVKCPECGATMRREERPGPGKDPDEVEEKRFDLEGNPSVWDIMDAINAIIRTPLNSRIYRYVADLYPTKYPDGHVIVEETKEKEGRKYLLYSYEYNSGDINLGESKEMEAIYQPKKRNIGDRLTAEIEVTDMPDIQEALKSIQDTVAELKEGRVLSRKNREVVKNAVNALMDVLKADSTGSREDDDKEEVEDEKDAEVVIEASEYPAEKLQAIANNAIQKALENMDFPKAVGMAVKKLQGRVE